MLYTPAILPHHRAAGQGNMVEADFDQLTKSQHEVRGWAQRSHTVIYMR